MSNLPSNERGSSRRSRRELAASSSQPGTLRMLYDRGIVAWRLFWDQRVSILPKLIPVAAIAYVLSPLDLLPALALGPVGTLDDVGIILLGFTMFIQAAPPDIVREHLRELSQSRNVLPAGEDENIVDGEILDE